MIHGELIVKFMKENDYTIERLAKEAQMDIEAIQNAINYDDDLFPVQVFKLCMIMKIRPSVLVYRLPLSQLSPRHKQMEKERIKRY